MEFCIMHGAYSTILNIYLGKFCYACKPPTVACFYMFLHLHITYEVYVTFYKPVTVLNSGHYMTPNKLLTQRDRIFHEILTFPHIVLQFYALQACSLPSLNIQPFVPVQSPSMLLLKDQFY
jgi:hypothetical protein